MIQRSKLSTSGMSKVFCYLYVLLDFKFFWPNCAVVSLDVRPTIYEGDTKDKRSWIVHAATRTASRRHPGIIKVVTIAILSLHSEKLQY